MKLLYFFSIVTFLVMPFCASTQVITATHKQDTLSSKIELNWVKQANSSSVNELNYTSTISFEVLKEKQPQLYRSFVINEPKVSEIHFNLAKKGYKNFSEKLKVKTSKSVSYTFIDTLPSNLVDIRINKVSIIYKDKQIATPQYVDNYFLDAKKLENIASKLSVITFNNPYYIYEQRAELDKYNKKINKILEQKYGLTLNLKENDPASFKKHLKLAQELLLEKDKLCAKKESNLHLMFYRYGIRAFYESEKADAFLKSIEVAEANNISFADPYYELAVIEFNNERVKESLNYLHATMANQPQNVTQTKAISLYGTIYEYFIQRANTVVYTNDKINYLYEAAEICNLGYLNVSCDAILQRIIDTRTQQFQEIVNEGINNKDYNKLGEALAYIEEYKSEISHPESVYLAFQNVYNYYINEAGLKTTEKKYSEALSILEEIENAEAKYDVVLLNETGLITQYTNIFEYNLQDSRLLLIAKNFEEGLSQVKISEQIQQEKFNNYADKIEQFYSDAYNGIYNRDLQNILVECENKEFENVKRKISELYSFTNEYRSYLSEDAENRIKLAQQNCYIYEFNVKLKSIDDILKSNDLILAKLSVQNLYFFRKSNAEWLEVGKDSQIDEQAKKVQNAFIKQGVSDIKLKEFNKSLDNFKNAQDLLLNDDEVSADKILNGFYDSYFGLAIQNSNKKLYEDALNFYYKANQINCTYKTKKSSEYKKQREATLKAFVLSILDEANTIIESNSESEFNATVISLLKAKIFKIHDLMYEQEFVLDSQTNSKLDKVKDLVFAEECKNAQKDYDIEFSNAQSAVSQLNYIEAINYFESAIQIAQNMSQCGINDSKSFELKQKYSLAADYQKLEKEVTAFISTAQYGKALSSYKKMQVLNSQENLASFNLTFIKLSQFILSHNNTNFIAYCAVDYCKSEPTLAFANELINVLFAKNLDFAFYYSFGFQMGQENKALFVGNKYKQVLLRYSLPANKQAKKFKKGFKKGFK